MMRFAEIAAEMLEFMGDSPLIAHNAPFDFGFLNAELKTLGLPPLAMEPSEHGNAVAQAPLFDTKVRPDGVGSATTTPAALPGPLLVTVIVNWAVSPGVVLPLPSARKAVPIVWRISILRPLISLHTSLAVCVHSGLMSSD